MAQVMSVVLVGPAYHNGRRTPGHGLVELDDDSTLYVCENEARGFNGCLEYAAERGHDTADYAAKLDNWVKTGKFGKTGKMNFSLR